MMETLYYGGTIDTMEPGRTAQAVLVRDDVIAAVGHTGGGLRCRRTQNPSAQSGRSLSHSRFDRCAQPFVQLRAVSSPVRPVAGALHGRYHRVIAKTAAVRRMDRGLRLRSFHSKRGPASRAERARPGEQGASRSGYPCERAYGSGQYRGARSNGNRPHNPQSGRWDHCPAGRRGNAQWIFGGKRLFYCRRLCPSGHRTGNARPFAQGRANLSFSRHRNGAGGAGQRS